MSTLRQCPDLPISATLQACKQALTRHYGKQLKGLILFGSAARQALTPTSDIDLLVLLDRPLDYGQELRAIVEVLYPLQLEADYWISAKPADPEEFAAGLTQLYRNIQGEGVLL
ncbi:MAG: nucleotidyltransferase domain-containing protein [Leptolyngbya sp. RL_3_1]|nr:nucleotidyltransferase domain-containing protein [Leptolyngbya sp. RL_3_1]